MHSAPQHILQDEPGNPDQSYVFFIHTDLVQMAAWLKSLPSPSLLPSCRPIDSSFSSLGIIWYKGHKKYCCYN
jgi:hypothetical protein